MKRVVVIVAVVVVATGLSGSGGRASTPSRIVFTADRAPSVSGEIYRLDPSGHRVDLSSSPFQDSGPVVSPDGQRVAFFSDRSGALSVWEVGINGGGLVRVGPSLPPPIGGPGAPWRDYYVDPGQGEGDQLSWQPHGGRLALVAGFDSLFILRPGREPLSAFVTERSSYLEGPGWSPDGRVLLAGDAGVLRAFSPTGGRLWRVAGARYRLGSPWSWSRRGLLALSIVPSRDPHVTWSGLRVYDERGHLHFAVHSKSVPGIPGWSPNGDLVAAVVGRSLEVWTGAGKPVLRTGVGGSAGCSDVVWASDRRVVVRGFDRSHGSGRPMCRVVGVDVRTGKRSPASSIWFRTRSADGNLAAVIAKSGKGFVLGVRPTAGGVRRTYAQLAACQPGVAPAASLQFAGHGRSLVYASYCPTPYTNLYSAAPDGGGLQQLTTATNVTQPALSPDASQIAYTTNAGLEIAGSSGASVILTPPTKCSGTAGETIPFPDSWASWSPDGKAILFSRRDCAYQYDLYTIPVSGGTPHGLGLTGDETTWGPSRIAYADGGGIWTANPDGTDAEQIATDGSNPAWSPDGRLAYLAGGNGTTVVVGSTQTQLPFAQVTSLAWSPDGTRFLVAARTTQTGPFDLYTVNTDGSNPVQLTHNYDALSLSWR